MMFGRTGKTPRVLAVIAAVGLQVGCDTGEGAPELSAAAAAGTTLSHPAEASGSGVPAGVPRFAVDPFWPQPLPNNWIIGQVAGLSVDADDHVWIIHRPWSVQPTNAGATPPMDVRGRVWGHDPLQAECCVTAPPVLEFDANGTLLRSWGGPGEGYEWFNSEHGIHVDPSGFVWVAGNGEGDHHILKFTKDGQHVLTIGGVGVSRGSNDTNSVNGAALMQVDAAANELYVADGYGNRRLIVFDATTGAYKRHWGAYGEPPVDEAPPAWDPTAPPSRTWRTPVHGLAISNDGLVYVTDRPSNRIQVFQKDGTYVREAILAPQTYGPGSTWDVALDPTDPEHTYVYVPDGTNNKIWILDRETLEVVYSWGRGGRQPGQFDWLHNLEFDSQGNIYTSEVQTGHRIQKFNRVGG
jgi:DNA-binding beta-propeller fold protein YncE